MKPIFQFLADRLKEPSTYAGLGTLLALVGVNLDPGTLAKIGIYGGAGAAFLAVVLKDAM